MSNRRKIKGKIDRRDGLRPHLDIDEVSRFSGRYNGYICDKCDKGFLTLDIDEGVTPMFSPCFATEGCNGRAHSMGYPEGEPPAYLGEPIIHWYKPKQEEMVQFPFEIRHHIERGGLVRKATSATPEWVKALL
jgi:hypothetical protein